MPGLIAEPAPAQRRWPAPLRRGPLEAAATTLICLGVFMLLQPLSLTLYHYSFVTTLVGTLMFMIVSKFPS
jgi:hypothetical protein